MRCASTAEAVRGADIVTTVTADKAYATILHGDLVEPGMHINAVGGDCPGKTELAAEVLRAASVFVEYEPQTRIEGDLQQMPADFPVTEFWRVVRGEAPARTSPAQVTVFDSVGFALEDYSALRFMRALGRSEGLLQPLELIPDQADPKDLYAQIQPWIALGTPAGAPAGAGRRPPGGSTLRTGGPRRTRHPSSPSACTLHAPHAVLRMPPDRMRVKTLAPRRPHAVRFQEMNP